MMREEQLLDEDERARSLALDVSRSFIVQAPAGSGKTELLIQRYLRLLVTVEDPEEVLAITFTRKAAAEMRLRVVQALQQVEHGDSPIAPHDQVTANAARAVLQQDKILQWDLIANPRRMRIQTLDSLNAMIARTQALTSSSGAAGNTIVADAEMRLLYRKAATLTLDQLPETGAMRDATEQVLLHVDNNTAVYVAYVARMLATREQWLPFVGSGLLDQDEEQQLRTRFEANLEGAVVTQLQRTHDSLPNGCAKQIMLLGAYAADQLPDANTRSNPIGALTRQTTVPDASAAYIPQWHGLAELLLTKQGQWRKTVTKTQGFPVGDNGQKQSMLEMLKSLADQTAFRDLLQRTRLLPPITYSDEQWKVLLALFRLLPLAVTELKRLFSERGINDYIEVALNASNAIGTAEVPGDVALLLDYQLRHLLIDEMQDTSSAQYRMLEALTGGWTEGDGRTLFCVGDPMQSIYRFRNAEVGQFLLARKAGIGNVALTALTLRRNFRSGENLVRWFNAVFPNLLPAADDPLQSAVAYSAAVSVPMQERAGSCVVHPVVGSDKRAEALLACEVIRSTLADNPDDDLAVLVRSRTHLRGLIAQLRQAGIAYRAVEIDRLTDLLEIIDILALTRALAHEGDRVAWLAVLRSPWVGLDWSDLHSLVSGHNNATVWQLLQSDLALAKLSDDGRRAGTVFRRIIRDTAPANCVDTLRDRIERTWLALGGPVILDDAQAVENVYRYLDVIEKLEQAGTLPDVAILEDTLDQEHVSSDSTARLQIMTMHRAKGLQFDHVLLHGLGRKTGRQERSVLSWFDIPGQHGSDEKIISPVGPRAEIENDPLHRFIEQTESAKYRNELGRLLYVACTRARKSLHLLGHVELTTDGSEIRSAHTDSLLSLLWPSVAAEFSASSAVRASSAAVEDNERWVMPVLRRFSSPWALPDSPAIPGQSGHASAVQDSRPVEFYWVGADARLAGIVVHRWLQLAADKRVSLDRDQLRVLRPASQRWLEEMGVAVDTSAAIIDRVETALRGLLDDAKGRWLLQGDGHAELPLSGLHDGRIESVVLDRVRIDDDGTHWIVDYKTSSHEGGDIENFIAAESVRYESQLAKYAELYRSYSGATVRCALYFPLLQKFVEVTV